MDPGPTRPQNVGGLEVAVPHHGRVDGAQALGQPGGQRQRLRTGRGRGRARYRFKRGGPATYAVDQPGHRGIQAASTTSAVKQGPDLLRWAATSRPERARKEIGIHWPQPVLRILTRSDVAA